MNDSISNQFNVINSLNKIFDLLVHQSDEYIIKMLIQSGRRSLNELEVNLGLSGLKREK